MAQRRWLARVGPELGFVVRDRETMTEVDLPGPEGAPVLGLVVHGDLQPVTPSEWTVPPFAATFKNGEVWGRGSADDKGPLVQALLAMAALRSSGLQRTHTVRLLVGTDEEQGAEDLETYKKQHPLPDLSLVLDSDFPVVVGEKAWAEWIVLAQERADPASGPIRGGGPRRGSGGEHRSRLGDADPALAQRDAGLGAVAGPGPRVKLPQDTTLEIRGSGPDRTLVAHGRAAHAGRGAQPRPERAGGARGGHARPTSTVRRLRSARVRPCRGERQRGARAGAGGARPTLGTDRHELRRGEAGGKRLARAPRESPLASGAVGRRAPVPRGRARTGVRRPARCELPERRKVRVRALRRSHGRPAGAAAARGVRARDGAAGSRW